MSEELHRWLLLPEVVLAHLVNLAERDAERGREALRLRVEGDPGYNARMKALVLVALLAACGSKKEKEKSNDLEDMKEEASVDWARKQLPEIDTQLASKDPGQASTTCAVIKPDMAAIKKADAKLAETLAKKCGPDLALRSLAVFVERAEAERAKDPDAKFLSECSGWSL